MIAAQPRPATHRHISSIDEIIAEAQNGRMFVLVDGFDGALEGALVVPAQMATPTALEFIDRRSGPALQLILPETVVGDLVQINSSAQTASPTAATSPRDRAQAIARVINAASPGQPIASDDIVITAACQGGALVCPRREEAALDIMRLAGLNASAVVAELVDRRGLPAASDDVFALAEQHGLAIGTVADLISYRRRHDHLVECIGEVPFPLEYDGGWRASLYRSKIDAHEIFVLLKGELVRDRQALVQFHRISLLDDLLCRTGSRAGLLQHKLQSVGDDETGIIFLQYPETRVLEDVDEPDLRVHGMSAQILADLGVDEVVLLNGLPGAAAALAIYGLDVSDRPIGQV